MADTDESRDRGFTLTEVIVVVLMVGVLASVMVAVVAVIVRNAPAAEVRAENSRSYQRLLQWLPRDAASTAPGQFQIGGSPVSPSCDDATGDNLVHMSWDEGSTTAVVEYRRVTDGDGVRVERFACSGPTFAATQTLEMTGKLNAVSPSPLKDSDDVIVGVLFTLFTCSSPSDCSDFDGTIDVVGGSHNPREVLPTTTTSSTTTTTTTTTTLPVVP